MADILIVGAGPTGLALAADLTQSGVSARVIDKAAAASDKSKALGVQAGTLELLGSAFGPQICEEMISAGRPTREAFIHIDDLAPIRIDLSGIPSDFNFILILPQSETERILSKRLADAAGRVERNCELLDLQDNGSGVTATLRHLEGPNEAAAFKFVIGCDGAHSAVRRAMGISFKGGAYEGDFILSDVILRWPWAYGSVHPFINAEGIMACFPFKGERSYRLVLVLRDMTPSEVEVSIDELRHYVRRLSGGAVEIESASWLTRFRVHHRMAESFRKGRVFLAGDAAHIHSPAGGQGMNIGIQDGLNLSAKLAKVLGGAPPALLDAYEMERMPIALGVVRGTDFISKMGLLPENAFMRFSRRHVFPKILRWPWLQRRVIKSMSEIISARQEIVRRGLVP